MTGNANKPKVRKRTSYMAGRKLRKDRVALVLTIFAIVVVGIIVLISRSCDDGSVLGTGSFSTPVPEAVEAGRKDALRVVGTEAGTMERQKALFDIHARESSMRENGYRNAADDYHNSAIKTLKENNINL